MSSNKYSGITRRRFLKNASVAAAGAAFVESILPVIPAAAKENKSAGSWFNDVYRQLHIDAHFGNFKEIYRNFDAEACAQIFDEIGVQMVSYFSKCWAGYSYYPTKIGIEHPGLERDFTGELTKALKKRGIRTIVYFMLGIERYHYKEHPDWIRNTESKELTFDDFSGKNGLMMCFRSPYVDQIGLPQMKEIVQLYDVDGFFIDIVMQQFLHSNCHCKYCRESLKMRLAAKFPPMTTTRRLSLTADGQTNTWKHIWKKSRMQ